jgi:hypothetical protein
VVEEEVVVAHGLAEVVVEEVEAGVEEVEVGADVSTGVDDSLDFLPCFQGSVSYSPWHGLTLTPEGCWRYRFWGILIVGSIPQLTDPWHFNDNEVELESARLEKKEI